MASKYLIEEIGTIEKGKTYHYFSEGLWSMHELLVFLLNAAGPSKVWLTSFSICEAAIRSFHNCLQDGKITELHCLFDYTTRKHKMSLLYFAKNVSPDLRICANHSKIILIENDTMSIVANCSANFNINARFEAGVISTEPDVFAFYKSKVLQAFEKAAPVTYEDGIQ